MTREEIHRRLDELAREYVETHNHEIVEELYRLARELRRWIKMKDQVNSNSIISTKRVADRQMILAEYRLADLLAPASWKLVRVNRSIFP